ncbi:hypothetical protein V8E36_002980, partial [Tilletia maclaganii]
IRAQPFFFLATDHSHSILSATWPATLLIGWEDLQLMALKLPDIIHPDDGIVLDSLLRSQSGDPSELRSLLLTGAASECGPSSSAHFQRGISDLPFGWYTRSAFPGPHHENRLLVRHRYGWFDNYQVRLHFCPTTGDTSDLASMILVWTFLKISNGRSFPDLIYGPTRT